MMAMANRRCLLNLTRYLHSLKTIAPQTVTLNPLFKAPVAEPNRYISYDDVVFYPHYDQFSRNFCSGFRKDDGEVESEEDDESSDDENERAVSAEDKEKEAAEIGYKVAGPLHPSERVFKPYEPVFAVVQIGSHQFKVSNGDCIYTERLKYCDINDKLILNKVLMLGSKDQTIIGRPILPDATVHAVVEEHALDAKVIIFKKKRRKNYRRTKGHRQELTKLRITDIQGIEKPEKMPPLNTQKKDKPGKVAVAA